MRTISLDQVATIHGGGKLGLTGNDFVRDGFPAFGAGGKNGYVPVAEYRRSGIILSSIGARCGKCFYVDGAWTTLANTQVILPNPEIVDARFLWYQLNDELSWPRSGSAQPFIKPSDVKHRAVVLLSLDEQRRIATILDHADALRAKRRQVLAHLDALATSNFLQTMSGRRDPLIRLDSLVAPGDRMNYGVVQPGPHVPNGSPLIRISNLSKGGVDLADIKMISPAIDQSCARSRIRGNEVLVGCVGSIGQISVVTPGLVGFNIARAITRVPIENPTTRRYVAEYLRTDVAQQYFIGETRTVAQPTLNVKQLAATMIPFPPLAVQAKLVAGSETINRVVVKVRSAQGLNDEVFEGLQTRAFRGEL